MNIFNRIKRLWVILTDEFLRHDLFKMWKEPADIGYVIDKVRPYDKADASIRLQCYNIIQELENRGKHIELYKPFRKYNVLIFMKCYSDDAVKIANKAHKKGVPIITEVFWEQFGDSDRIHTENNILSIVRLAQMVCTCSEVQVKKFSKYHDNVILLPEAVERINGEMKKHKDASNVQLIWCGYSAKAKDLLCIKEVINKMIHEKGAKLLLVTEKDPGLEDIIYEYECYNQKRIAEQIKKGDIMIAPRPMEGIEERSNSLARIALPLSVGIPVVASPVPSYKTSPAILCTNDIEWEKQLEKLIDSVELRGELGQAGIEFTQKNLSLDVVGDMYLELIKQLM